MTFAFNSKVGEMKSNEEFKKKRTDAAFDAPTYWRFSRTQMNTGEYVPTMAMLMFYLFTVYKGSTMPGLVAYSCLVPTIGSFSFAFGYATQKGTIWGHSVEPPFKPPPFRLIGTMMRYIGCGMLIYSAYAASV